MKKLHLFDLPSNKIIFRYISTIFLIVILITSILPTLLNYPPNSLNNDFDIQMSGIPFVAQIFAIFMLASVILILIFKNLFKDIDLWYKDNNHNKYKDYARMQKIRKQCFSLPYLIFFGELIIPVIGIIFVLTITGSHHNIMIFKILLLLVSFFLFLAVASYITSKNLYTKILRDTYYEKSEMKPRVSLKQKIFLQVLPVSIMGVLLTSLIAYNQVIKTKEEYLFNNYHKNLIETFDLNTSYNSGEVIKTFSEIPLSEYSDSKFIIKPDGSVLTVEGHDPSEFVVEYTKQLSSKNNGHTYDGYGIDTQGATIKVITEEGIYTLGILYSVDSSETLIFLLVDFLFVVFVTFIFLNMFSISLQKDISTVTDSLNAIAKSSNNMSKLPILSNDEIGDLCNAYNSIQVLTEKNIEQIKSNQDLLIERERLASLGQMVGGIAHNLKTPIMSIAGADEGLTQLVAELDASIGNPMVTNEDYHAIAKDMQEWIDKIKTHTSYMSDVITAVKGQAVTLSDSQVYPFSISDLFKQVDILMKHELKSALVTLRVSNNVDDNIKINGNINSLVQVLNNMISNSIQAYDGKSDEFIDLVANLRDNTTIELIVKDYGPGLPKVVQDNLFKQMITTKGKGGTGLGLFMSYSNIKAHFHGDMTFETEKNKGTTFIITIPINKL